MRTKSRSALTVVPRGWRQFGAVARGYAITLAEIGAAVLVSHRLEDTLNTLNLSLIYLFVVLLAATNFGYGPAVMASALGIIVFYVEYYPPYGFNSDLQAEDWLTLFFFLAFAIAISRLSSAARARAVDADALAREAQAREKELRTLQHLRDVLQGDEDLPTLLRGLAQRLRSAFMLSKCAVLLVNTERGALGSVASSGESLDTDTFIDIPLQAGDRQMGVLRLWQSPTGARLDPGDLSILTIFAKHASVAIEHARLTAEAHEAAVLREADRLKTSLLRLISHDLRTPLATIKARTSSILEGDVQLDSEEWAESMRAIDLEADRLSRLVTEVLELSRIEAEAIHPHFEPYTAEELISTVLPHMEGVASRHHLELDVPDDLPPVLLDIVLIGQVLTNLLENAFKYSPPGSTVQLSARTVEGGLLLCIDDQGPGIPTRIQERIFDAFFRGEQHASTQGAGLGLAICRGLVAAHHGWIRTTEAPEGGGRFLVWLPSEPAAVDGIDMHSTGAPQLQDGESTRTGAHNIESGTRSTLRIPVAPVRETRWQ